MPSLGKSAQSPGLPGLLNFWHEPLRPSGKVALGHFQRKAIFMAILRAFSIRYCPAVCDK